MTSDGRPATTLEQDRPFSVEFAFDVREPIPTLNLAVSVHNLRGIKVLDESWFDSAPPERGAPGSYVARMTLPAVLPAGSYSLSVWIGSAYETLVWEPDALGIRLEGAVEASDRVVHLRLPWEVRRTDARS
ncbi:hypothetical protein FSW04_13620 [Baekduia soli]|uniref:Wzt C-terminal domain-containing protein n=2 Tax=Baekduia soli TaxID=496014 RepID=A0A5B8UD27_9ACTN|nr:hypothetical protein FSW04_13620 [Baekduia soli]